MNEVRKSNESEMSLKKQTIHGIKWQVSASFASKAVSFITTIIVARHLGPSVYGLFSFAMIIVTGFELFKSMGIDTALLRRRDDFDLAANTAFFIIPLLGISLYVLLIIVSPLVGVLLGNKDIIPVVRILGIIFVIQCFSKIPVTKLEREMQFRKISLADFSTMIIFSISVIIFTFLNLGVWSLVYAYIIRIFIFMILVWTYARWKPRFSFDKKIALEMLTFGKFIFLEGVVYFLKNNLDNLLVGKLLGMNALGLYAIAFNIANFSTDYFGSKVYRVTYPAYSKLQGDLKQLQSVFLKVFKYVCLVAIPLGIGILLLGDEFIKFVYGEKWLGAIGILKILAFVGIFNTLPTSISPIFLACGKPKLALIATLLQVAIYFLFIIPMAKLFGVNGVGIVVCVSSFVGFLFYLIKVKKILDIESEQVYKSIKTALISSFAMGLVIIILKHTLLQYKINILSSYNFMFLFVLAISVYVFLILKIDRKIFTQIRAYF